MLQPTVETSNRDQLVWLVPLNTARKKQTATDAKDREEDDCLEEGRWWGWVIRSLPCEIRSVIVANSELVHVPVPTRHFLYVFSFVRRGRKVRSQVATPNCAPQAATVDQQFTCEHAWLVIKKKSRPSHKRFKLLIELNLLPRLSQPSLRPGSTNRVGAIDQ